MNLRYAVVGLPIKQSLSPMLHRQFASEVGLDLSYEPMALDEGAFEAQVRAFFMRGGRGLNVTAPGKRRAFELADVKTPRCLQARTANTLWMDKQGRLHADNTDGVGLVQDLKKRINCLGARILVLGAGGAAQGIVPVLLNEKPTSMVIFNRTQSRAEALVGRLNSPVVKVGSWQAMLASYDLVLNTTGQDAFELNQLAGMPLCYDFAYARSGVTPFVARARRNGFAAVDGFGLLFQQAREAFYVWHGVRPGV